MIVESDGWDEVSAGYLNNVSKGLGGDPFTAAFGGGFSLLFPV
jgi:hypothetical protein